MSVAKILFFSKFYQKVLLNGNFHIIFVSVFHRILDFKAGLDFYLGPFFLPLLLYYLSKITGVLFRSREIYYIFIPVFHRILDFKAGLDFYLGPFFI